MCGEPMNRHRLGRPSTAMVLLTVLLSVSAPAPAVDFNVDCLTPEVFPDADVNVVILPYDYAGKHLQLSEAARRLAMLIQLDTIFSIAKYGSVGAVHTVQREAADQCQPATVLAQLTNQIPGAKRTLRQGGGLVLLWGQLYEEGDDLYVQTYVRFLRREQTEELTIEVRNRSFTVRPPSQALAFPPRHMTRKDLGEIERAFKERVMVRESPNDQAKGAPPIMDLSADQQTYSVTAIQGEWIRIRSMSLRHFSEGWVHAGGSSSSWPLRRTMPELAIVDALAGYLRMRVAADAGKPMQEQMLKWVEEAASRYADTDSDADDPLPISVVRSTTGMLRMQRIKPGDATIRAVRQAWTGAAALVPYNSAARNLDVMGRLCTLLWAPNASSAEVAPPQRSFFRFAADNLTGALALGADDPDIAKNLAQIYLLLLSPNAPTEPTALNPLSTEELKTRLAALRTAVPTKLPESPPIAP